MWQRLSEVVKAVASITLLFVLSACEVPPATTDTPAKASGSACRVSYVVDGDTVHLNCGSQSNIKARLMGFDTPEIFSPKCGLELQAGLAAKDELDRIVSLGTVTSTSFLGHDRYGRALVRLAIDGTDVAQSMMSTGLARPYSGGRHPDWCTMLGRAG
jgi:endonuclease YncB( thermonuclease family)